eukprot:307867_1
MAQDELQRQFDSKIELKKKKELHVQREAIKEMKMAMTGKTYDGRIYNPLTGRYEGHILKAGNFIGYWRTAGIVSLNYYDNWIETKITGIGDEFEVTQKKTIAVVHYLSPPFWDTEVAALPMPNPLNPVLYPLKQCRLIPSEAPNELTVELEADRLKANKTFRGNDWSGFGFNSNSNNSNVNNNIYFEGIETTQNIDNTVHNANADNFVDDIDAVEHIEIENPETVNVAVDNEQDIESIQNNDNNSVSQEIDINEVEAQIEQLLQNDVKDKVIETIQQQKHIKHHKLLSEVQSQMQQLNLNINISLFNSVLLSMLNEAQYIRRDETDTELYHLQTNTSADSNEAKQNELIESKDTIDIDVRTDRSELKMQEVVSQTEEKKQQTRFIATVRSTVQHMRLVLTHIQGKTGHEKIQECTITWIIMDKQKLQDIKYRLATEKKSHNVSAHWVKKQRIPFIVNLLVGMFALNRNELNNIKLKNDLLRIAFDKLQFKVDPADTTKLEFKNHELHEIEAELNKIKDIDVDIYYFLINKESYHSNNNFMRVLNLLIAEPDFIIILCQIWNIFRQFLHNTPTPGSFEKSFQAVYLRNDKYDAVVKMECLYKQLNLQSCEVSFSLFSRIVIRNFKLLFIVKLRGVIWIFLDIETVISPGKVTEYQVFAYGGAVLCTILHIWYNSNIKQHRKIIYIRLTKSLTITPSHKEYLKVSKQLRYENKGHFYVMSPVKLFTFTQIILNRCWEQAERSYYVRFELPDYNGIIKQIQSDDSLKKSFVMLFDRNDVLENAKYIEDIFNKYVNHCCSKIVSTSIDQLGLNEIGMDLRDQFKYEHIKNQ